MKESLKKNIIALIAVVLSLILLSGMIASTIILSTRKTENWEYNNSSEAIDYYSDSQDFDKVIGEFRNKLLSYFNELFGSNGNQFVDFGLLYSSYADAIVNACSLARIPPSKLEAMADALERHSVSSVFARIKNAIGDIKDIEDFEKILEKYLSNYSFISVLSNFLNGFLSETTLSETELARMVYYYLINYSSKEYAAYLVLMGEDVFVEILSNTISVISMLKSLSSNANSYGIIATTGSIKSVLYQLGSIYCSAYNAFAVNGITDDTLEKALCLTWDFNSKYLNREALQERSERIRGKLADLLYFLGTIMKNIGNEDIEAYLNYSYSDDETKENLYICSALKLAETVEVSFNKAKNDMKFKYDSIEDLSASYADVSIVLGEIWALQIDSGIDDAEEVNEVKKSVFSNFSNGCAYLNSVQYTSDNVKALDKNSEDYIKLYKNASDFFAIGSGLSVIMQELAFVWIGNIFYATAETTETK